MRKVSKAEAGKLGAEKSKLTNALKKQERIDQYMLNPNSCNQCGNIFDYSNRKKKFCNSSCSATYNNRNRESKIIPKTWYCLNCNKEHNTVEWKVGKYCNNTCQHEFQYTDRIRQWLEEGKSWDVQVPQWAKRYLSEQNGYFCSVCGISEWNRKTLILECDHIDGDHKNNSPENLRLMCPNCHSQTNTYKAKNTGNGRKYRRIS